MISEEEKENRIVPWRFYNGGVYLPGVNVYSNLIVIRQLQQWTKLLMCKAFAYLSLDLYLHIIIS